MELPSPSDRLLRPIVPLNPNFYIIPMIDLPITQFLPAFVASSTQTFWIRTRFSPSPSPSNESLWHKSSISLAIKNQRERKEKAEEKKRREKGGKWIQTKEEKKMHYAKPIPHSREREERWKVKIYFNF